MTDLAREWLLGHVEAFGDGDGAPAYAVRFGPDPDPNHASLAALLAKVRSEQREADAAFREEAMRLAMMVMGEAYDVEMGDSDGNVGPSDDAVKLAMQIAATRAPAQEKPE